MCCPCNYNPCCSCDDFCGYRLPPVHYTTIQYAPIPTPAPVQTLPNSVNIDPTPQTVGTGTTFSLNGVNSNVGTATTFNGNSVTLNENGTYLISSDVTLATSSDNTAYPIQITASNGDNRTFNVYYDNLTNNGTGSYSGAIVVNNAPVTLSVQNASGVDVTANRVELDVVKIA